MSTPIVRAMVFEAKESWIPTDVRERQWLGILIWSAGRSTLVMRLLWWTESFAGVFECYIM